MPNATVYTGDALATLLELPPASVDAIVTSPPFYRQRDYGTAVWSGGSPDCDHKPTRKGPHTRADCTLCGATRLDFQLGVESTPSAYIAALTGVLEAARTVLKPSGTLWLNLGDTYSGGGRGQTPGPAAQVGAKAQTAGYLGRLEIEGVAAKQLLGIPWRVALALQEAGWWLRSDIIWHKPNPLPESVRDRPTSAHEYLFLLAKSERYYYDWEAVAEPSTQGTPRRQRDVWTIPTRAFNAVREGLADTDHYAVMPDALVRPAILASTSERGVCPRCGEPWVRHTEQTPKDPGRAKGDLYIAKAYTTPQSKPSGKDRNLAGDPRPQTTLGWLPSCVCHLPPGMEPDALRVILSPTDHEGGDDPTLQTGRRGLNRQRGADEGQRPMTRYEQRRYAAQLRGSPHRQRMEAEAGPPFAHYLRTDYPNGARAIPTALLERWLERGLLERVYVPQADPLPPIPATVLDPFCGAATVGKVALEEGRDFIGIELNPAFVDLSRRRLARVKV